MRVERWVARLFLAVALFQLVPVWSAPFFPTVDGPSHVYNAYVLQHLALHRGGPIAQTYAIDWRPNPNVSGHVALALLLFVFTPAVAEKLLVSAIVLLFLAGAWMLAGASGDPRARVYAFLAVPFAHHELLQFGFYNYAISAGLFAVTLAWWWQRRDRPDRRTIAVVALLTLLCYASHPSSTVLLIASIGVLWLLTLRGRVVRVYVRHAFAFAPVLPFLGWFFLKQRGRGVGELPSIKARLVSLARFEILLTHRAGQVLQLGVGLAIVFALLIVVTLVRERRWREVDAFGVLALIFVALYLVTPGEAAGGSFVSERLAALIPLIPIAWFTPRLNERVRVAVIAALAIVAATNALFLARWDRETARETTAFVRAARGVGPNTTLLTLNGQQTPIGDYLPLLLHASGYVGVDRKLVLLDNYEPGAGYFPVKLRPGVPSLDIFEVQSNPANVDIDVFAPYAQVVFTWRLRDDAPVYARLDRHYKLMAISKEGRIYRRYGSGTLEMYDDLLLPIGGTPHAVQGAGEQWTVDQTMRNVGRDPVDVRLSDCTPPPCDFELAPGQSRRLAFDDFRRPFIIARFSRPVGRDIAVDTVATRTAADGSVTRTAIPSIPLASFRTRSIDIPAVVLGGRNNLRVWMVGATPFDFQLIALSEDGKLELARKTVEIQPTGFFTGDATALLAPLQGRVRLRIDALRDDVRVWAFVTSRGAKGDVMLFPRQ